MLRYTTRYRTALTFCLAPCALFATTPTAIADPTTVGAQYFEQDTGTMPDFSEHGNMFGSVVAQGDFNCDGIQDLAVGTPEEGYPGASAAGKVTVVYGSPDGLDLSTSIGLSQVGGSLSGGLAGTDHQFGAALAVANFDDDQAGGIPCDDLAIGVPGMSLPASGGVIVVPGSVGGLDQAASYHFGSSDISGVAEFAGDAFGAALAAGDFNGDGYPDLAIGGPGRDVNGQVDAGRFYVIGGTHLGLSPPQSPILQSFSQGFFGAAIEAGDRFGSVLAAGDFNREGGAPNFDDLVIGVPDEDVLTPEGTEVDAGAIIAVYGTPVGLFGAGSQIVTQDDLNGFPTAFDRFGASLAVGDFTGEGVDDVAIGAPGQDAKPNIGGEFVEFLDAGRVHVLAGHAGDDLDLLGDWRLDRYEWFGLISEGDEFGQSLAAADFDLDGATDLAIGTPGGHISGVSGAGVVHMMYGPGSGALFLPAGTLYQSGPALGTAETGDAFGWSVTAGDFDGDGDPDLAAGVPFEETVSLADAAGAVNAFYNDAVVFSDSFESGDLSAWSAVSK